MDLFSNGANDGKNGAFKPQTIILMKIYLFIDVYNFFK